MGVSTIRPCSRRSTNLGSGALSFAKTSSDLFGGPSDSPVPSNYSLHLVNVDFGPA